MIWERKWNKNQKTGAAVKLCPNTLHLIAATRVPPPIEVVPRDLPDVPGDIHAHVDGAGVDSTEHWQRS